MPDLRHTLSARTASSASAASDDGSQPAPLPSGSSQDLSETTAAAAVSVTDAILSAILADFALPPRASTAPDGGIGNLLLDALDRGVDSETASERAAREVEAEEESLFVRIAAMAAHRNQARSHYYNPATTAMWSEQSSADDLALYLNRGNTHALPGIVPDDDDTSTEGGGGGDRNGSRVSSAAHVRAPAVDVPVPASAAAQRAAASEATARRTLSRRASDCSWSDLYASLPTAPPTTSSRGGSLFATQAAMVGTHAAVRRIGSDSSLPSTTTTTTSSASSSMSDLDFDILTARPASRLSFYRPATAAAAARARAPPPGSGYWGVRAPAVAANGATTATPTGSASRRERIAASMLAARGGGVSPTKRVQLACAEKQHRPQQHEHEREVAREIRVHGGVCMGGGRMM